MRNMARCNHKILALQLPTTAAILSALSAGSSSALCFSWPWHHQLPSHTHLHIKLPSSSALSPFRPVGLSNHCFLANKYGRISWNAPCRRYSVAASGKPDGSDEANDIISSIRDSLRYDIVQHHLDLLSASSSAENNVNIDRNDDPAIVLLLAVSGGCDSIALFHAILSLTKPDEQYITKDNNVEAGSSLEQYPLYLCLGKSDEGKNENDFFRFPCELHVAHFNHEQRDESSDGDEAFVRNLCMQNGVPFHCYSWSEDDFSLGEAPMPSSRTTEIPDGSTFNKEFSKESFTQDTARKWRRRKLKELLSNLVLMPNTTTGSGRRWGAILTAHHRDDADETLLLKLLRGSHLTNLWSMDAISDGFDLQLKNDTFMGSDSLPQFSSVGYFVKPMLNVRKRDIMEYLTSKSLKWREDESNRSNKYKRNKVRNELMPLLSEIAGGDSALQKRLSNLEQQSRDASRDISERAKDYLQSIPPNSPFVLPKNAETQFNLVHEEALHSWIMDVTDRKLHLSYDQMLRIRDQIRQYPGRLQWKLDVGSDWKIQRNGETLDVSTESEDSQPPKTDKYTEKAPWMIDDSLPMDLDKRNFSDKVELSFGPLPATFDHSNLRIKRVKDIGNVRFKPPWRIGRSAIKIKELLRGQKVPLHLRDEAAVLCLSENSTRHALAVYLESTEDGGGEGRWIVNANFCPQDDSNLPVTKVVLGKTS